jgi:protein-glutamine gamma-glutamyltransferase
VRPRPSPPLSRAQLHWLAALLACAQLPLWPHVLAWAGVIGTGLLVARVALPERLLGVKGWGRWLLPLLALAVGAGIRSEFGYFLARDPCVEFLYVLVGIKFLEARAVRDGTLLICLALFLSLTQFFYGQSLLAALLAMPTLFALGGTLSVLRGTTGAYAKWRYQLNATMRLLIQGIPIAALLFVLFPRLAGPLWGSPSDAAGRSGLSDTMTPGSISALSLSDAVAFRVSFVGAPPRPSQRYWRGPVFTRFDGREWRSQYRLQPGTLAPGSGPVVDYTVTMEPHGKQWLFALEHPAGLPQPAADDASSAKSSSSIGTLTYDQQLVARTPVTQTLRYRQRSWLGSSYPESDADNPRDALQLPRNNPRTQAYASEWRSHFSSDRSYIDAVLNWFREENFVYTLSPAVIAHDAVDGFLFDTRRGFCEHYAGAFVLLMRAAGIPSRVVTGYQGGEMNPEGEYMIVRDSDAHAWAEVLLDGRWQRVDPTAAVAPSRIERGLGAALPAEDRVPYFARMEMTWLKDLRLRLDAINYRWQRGVVGFTRERQRGFFQDIGIDQLPPWQLVVVAATMVFAWGMAVLAVGRLRRSRYLPELVLWQRVCTRLARAGLARRPDEGPLDYARRAAARWPELGPLLTCIGDTYARLRYGPRDRRRATLIGELRAAVTALPAARALRS